VLCPIGRARIIASFFSRVLGVLVDYEEAGRATVRFESGKAGLVAQQLVFEESADAQAADAYDRSEAAGVHLALYLPDAESFAAAFGRVHAAGLLYINPRFEGGPPEFASAKSLEEALECGQFRVKDCVEPDSGELGIVLELEVRYPAHSSYPLHDADDRACL
jgi:catechol 2,3-dioxygenase-like lactoylglutathione lyase family enzyme